MSDQFQGPSELYLPPIIPYYDLPTVGPLSNFCQHPDSLEVPHNTDST